jgi:environmental stress-induced protein Ves
MQVVRLDEVAPQPWRNGGGSTQELLAWPAPAAWLLRISVARIDASGPFSAYPGIERWFAVLSGEGVVLRFAARRALLSAGSEPMRFEGAAAPQCELLEGPTQDLNLMVKSEAGRGRMTRVVADEDWISSAAVRAVYTAEAASLHSEAGATTRLPAGTLAWSEHAADHAWRLQPDNGVARAWWMQFKRRPA